MDEKDIEKLGKMPVKRKFKVEAEETVKMKYNLYCMKCQTYGHIPFNCRFQGPKRKYWRQMKNIKEDINQESIKEEIKRESIKEKDIEKLERKSVKRKYKEELEETVKMEFDDAHCNMCQAYGHVPYKECVVQTDCFNCGFKGHVRKDCKEGRGQMKNIKEEIKRESVKEEIKRESIKEDIKQEGINEEIKQESIKKESMKEKIKRESIKEEIKQKSIKEEIKQSIEGENCNYENEYAETEVPKSKPKNGDGHSKRKIMVEEGYTSRKIMEVGKRPERELYQPGSANKQSRKDDFYHEFKQKKCKIPKKPTGRHIRKIRRAEKCAEKCTKEISPGSVFDSHCHLDLCELSLSREVNTLEKMLEVDGEGMKLYRKGGSGKFGGCIAIYCDPRKWSHRLLEKVQQRGVYISLGCHPHFVEHLSRDSLKELESLVRVESRMSKLVALGEIGLDYSPKNRGVKKEVQKNAFKTQLKLALKYQLPVVLNIREAEEDGYEVLQDAQVPASYPLHLHCFTGGWKEAKRWLRKFPGSVIGLTGVVTFPNAQRTHKVARKIPLDRLILETDAPYYLPKGVEKEKYKDSVCLPGHVIHAAERIAALRGDNVQNILEANLKNVERIYGFKIAK